MSDDRDVLAANLVADLQQSEVLFRTIFENAPVMIDQFDAEGRCLLWNRACEEQLGYTQAEVEACEDPMALFYPGSDERARVMEAIRKADGTFREYRVRAKDGSDRIQLWADFRLPDGAQISMGHDITDQRRIEQRLRQSQKLEALGQLTGGMAHDFNNLLTVVLANAELLPDFPPGSQEADDALDGIIRAATRGATIVQKLLAVGRADPVDVSPLDLQAVVHELAPTARRLLPESIRIRVATEPPIPKASADQGAVEQILINLITNARDAMKGRGTLTVALETRWMGDAEAQMMGCTPGEHVAIVVSDNGAGMDEETQLRAFEPFFTTKRAGGTGLGMPMVYGLMKQQGGTVYVESQPSKGTDVHLLFQVARPASVSAQAPDPSAGRLLVVEDEGSIRRLTVAMLTHAGYVVEEAPDGHHGLAALRAATEPFDLVLCDLRMPGLDGVELLEAAHAEGVAPAFLFVTGHADDHLRAHLEHERVAGLVRKPFRLARLLDAVAQAMEEA